MRYVVIAEYRNEFEQYAFTDRESARAKLSQLSEEKPMSWDVYMVESDF